MKIKVSSEELTQGQLSASHLEQAINVIREEGYVILRDIVSHSHLDFLNQKMTQDSHTIVSSDSDRWDARRSIGHLQQGAPPYTPYLFPDIVANPIVEHVSISLLGEGAFNGFYNGNTNTPGSTQQALHMDTGHLWPNLNPSHPTASVVVNIPMIDVTEEGGAIELWPGTHLIGDVSRRLDEEVEEARRQVKPPVRGTTQKGDVLIRDMRLWHRGTPNLSDRHRHMIALVHNVSWFHRGQPIRYVKGGEEAFKNSRVDPHAVFLDQTYDYLFDYRGPNS